MRVFGIKISVFKNKHSFDLLKATSSFSSLSVVQNSLCSFTHLKLQFCKLPVEQLKYTIFPYILYLWITEVQSQTFKNTHNVVRGARGFMLVKQRLKILSQGLFKHYGLAGYSYAYANIYKLSMERSSCR